MVVLCLGYNPIPPNPPRTRVLNPASPTSLGGVRLVEWLACCSPRTTGHGHELP
jgi:hypothetical protein